MPKHFFTKEEVQHVLPFVETCVEEILERQAELNLKYNSNWVNTYDDNKFIMCCVEEIVELKGEIEQHVSLFNHKTSCRFDKALEEFVDVMHFLASRALNEPFEQDKMFKYEVGKNLPETLQGWLAQLSRNVTARRVSPQVLADVFLNGCAAFHLRPEVMFVAYLHKHSKNIVRALAHALDEDAQKLKQAETPCYQYLLETGAVTLTAEEFNTKLRELYS